VFTLTEKAVEQLRRDHLRLSYQVRNLSVQVQASSHAVGISSGCYLGKTTSEITAFSASAPGSGTAAIYYRNTTDGNATRKMADGGEIRVYNVGNSAIPQDTFCIFSKDGFGTWWVVVVPCE
jgi:hypothetical protein